MAAEITDPRARRRLLAADPIRHVELLDVLDRDGPDALGLWTDRAERPAGLLAVQWGGGPVGLSNVVEFRPARVSGLGELLAALPRGRGRYEILAPFWAAPALEEAFRTEVQGPVSRYRLRPDDLRPHPAAARTVPFDEPELAGLAFPRTVADAPHRALVLRDELVAVAVTTALADGVARIGVHVVETHRGHGFGAGVAAALAADLLERGLTPTASVWLADPAAVRLVEGLGMIQVETVMRVTGAGRHAP